MKCDICYTRWFKDFMSEIHLTDIEDSDVVHDARRMKVDGGWCLTGIKIGDYFICRIGVYNEMNEDRITLFKGAKSLVSFMTQTAFADIIHLLNEGLITNQTAMQNWAESCREVC
jgi:hypothetical protein